MTDMASRSEPENSASVPARPCRIVELLQYSCKPQRVDDERGVRTQVHCFPVPRILRICEGRPAMEITTFVNIDSKTGAVEIPSDARNRLPKGRPWRDVYRYPPGQQHDLHPAADHPSPPHMTDV